METKALKQDSQDRLQQTKVPECTALLTILL